MRKFKIVKKFPGGPEVGTVLVESDIKEIQDGKLTGFPYGVLGAYCYVKSDELLNGFCEEIIEQDEFFVLSLCGGISACDPVSYEHVPKWLRFKTKESAERYSKALKDTHNEHEDNVHGLVRYELCESLNDRVE